MASEGTLSSFGYRLRALNSSPPGDTPLATQSLPTVRCKVPLKSLLALQTVVALFPSRMMSSRVVVTDKASS